MLPLTDRLPHHARTSSSGWGLFRTLTTLSLQILAILYLLSFMDRGNIGNARLANLEVDL